MSSLTCHVHTVNDGQVEWASKHAADYLRRWNRIRNTLANDFEHVQVWVDAVWPDHARITFEVDRDRYSIDAFVCSPETDSRATTKIVREIRYRLKHPMKSENRLPATIHIAHRL